MKKILILFVICIATIFIFSAKGVVYGDSISSLEDEISLLETENEKLEREIANLISCGNIYEKGSEEAFWDTFSLSSISIKDFSVALKR